MKKLLLILLLILSPQFIFAASFSISIPQFHFQRSLYKPKLTQQDQDTKTILGIGSLLISAPVLILGSRLTYDQGQGIALAAGIVGTINGAVLLVF